jgi:hypothetical protein
MKDAPLGAPSPSLLARGKTKTKRATTGLPGASIKEYGRRSVG